MWNLREEGDYGAELKSFTGYGDRRLHGLTGALAKPKPVQLSLWSPAQIVPEDQSISGVRLSLIYGVNADVSGLDLGLVTKTTGNQVGASWAFVHLNEGDFLGYQDGLVNRVRGDFLGWKSGFVNLTGGKFSGLQTGFVNQAGVLHGVQLGIWNSASSLDGALQIGILNFNKSGKPHGFLPIVNWSF